jgi:two-component system chemotaxis response regulator CheY
MKTVLIVDDSKTMRMLVCRALRQAGFAIETFEAENAEIAVDFLKKKEVNLILSDWNMPGMTGLEFLQSIRAAGNNTPFVFITSQSTAQTASLARVSGAAALIAKPFTREHIQEVLQPFLS